MNLHCPICQKDIPEDGSTIRQWRWLEAHIRQEHKTKLNTFRKLVRELIKGLKEKA